MSDLFRKTASTLIYFLMFSLVASGMIFLIITPTVLSLNFQRMLEATFVPLLVMGLLFEPIIYLRKRLWKNPNVGLFKNWLGRGVYYVNLKGMFFMLLDSILFSLEWTFAMMLFIAVMVNFSLGYYNMLFCLLIIVGTGLSFAFSSRSIKGNLIIFTLGIFLLAAYIAFDMLLHGMSVTLNTIISMITVIIFILEIVRPMEDHM